MDYMEDSGFDSDPKQSQSDSAGAGSGTGTGSGSRGSGKARLATIQQEDGSLMKESGTVRTLKKSDLQKKLERQREIARRTQTVDQQQRKSQLLSRSRLIVPTKREIFAGGATYSISPDSQPLVMLETDESEDEYEISHVGLSTNKEIAQQLIKDGYNLDLQPDDEDLDLIPPRPLNERCICCGPPGYYCVIQ